MLDVLHYFLEEDLVERDSIQNSPKTSTRQRIYKQFYDYDYGYPELSSDSYTDGSDAGYAGSPTQIDAYDVDINSGEMRNLKAFNPKDNPAKPYVPATNFDGTSQQPFGNLLDAPLK